jgi:hypothetical protein
MNKLNTLNAVERCVTIAAVSYAGDNRHPVADIENILSFDAGYVSGCLEKAIPHLTAFHAHVARRVLMRLASK